MQGTDAPPTAGERAERRARYERATVDLEPPFAIVDLGAFDANAAATRQAMAKSDADYFVPWTLKQGGTVFFTMPRYSCLRSFVLNHMVHHRAQLAVYLRLNNIAVPAMYGPSADES